MQIGRNVAEGLSHLHQADIVHRDLKPSNILFDDSGRAKVADLGLAQADSAYSLSERSVGAARAHPGTPGWKSPEQEDIHTYLSPASDVYALGLVMFRLLTGRQRQYVLGKTAQDLRPETPKTLSALVEEMLARDFRQRPQDGEAALQRLSEEQNALRQTPARAETARADEDRRRREQENTAKAEREQRIRNLRTALGQAMTARAWPRARQSAGELLSLVPGDAETQRNLREIERGEAEDAARRKKEVAERNHKMRRALLVGGGGAGLLAVANGLSRLLTPAAPIVPTLVPTPLATDIKLPSIVRKLDADHAILTLAPGVELMLVRIPAGEFLMGSDKAKDQNARDDELPQHKLNLAEYWMGKTEVTVAHFMAFIKATGYKTRAEEDKTSWANTGYEWGQIPGADWSHPKGPRTNVLEKQNHPVTHISWGDAIAFCKWITELAKITFKLPTEAEWEKASRGIDGRIYQWGEEAPGTSWANFYDMDTTPVGKYGTKGASPYGLDDMAGNVCEWVSSLYLPYPYNSEDGRENIDAYRWRVARGGSFYEKSRESLRCASRYKENPSYHSDFFGFRVCARSI